MSRDRFVNEKLEYAKDIFAHYFENAVSDGLGVIERAEIDNAVDAIFEAAVKQAKLELRGELETLKQELEEDISAATEASELRAGHAQRVTREGL